MSGWLKTQSKDDLSIAVSESGSGLSDTSASFDPNAKNQLGWYSNSRGAAAIKKTIKNDFSSIQNRLITITVITIAIIIIITIITITIIH